MAAGKETTGESAAVGDEPVMGQASNIEFTEERSTSGEPVMRAAAG